MSKEHSMKNDSVETIIKDHGGIVAVAKTIATTQDPCGIDEHAFTKLVQAEALRRWPDMKANAAAFAKLFTESGEESKTLSAAWNVVKNMPIRVSLDPVVTSGPDAFQEAASDTESSEAYQQLVQIGKDRWPNATEAQQFANAFADAANAALAAKAHRRPQASGAYPYPRLDAATLGSTGRRA